MSLYILNRKTNSLIYSQRKKQKGIKMAKILREISEESEKMERQISIALSKRMNVPVSSISGKMIVNMAIKELYGKFFKKA